MLDRKPLHTETGVWLSRRMYRKEFGLTASQMDDEPIAEVNYMLAIMQLEAKRQKKDNKAMERNTHNGQHN